MNTLQGEKYLWKMPACDRETILHLASTYNLSFPIVQALLNRGYNDKKSIDSYLFSSYEAEVAHPSLMKDMVKSVERLIKAIENNEKILVFGDYDVDGVTSSALMMIGLLPLNAQVNFFIPNRVRDGYGISTRIVERAARNGYTVIMTVDNGITAFEPATKAKELGIDLIITDHHRPHDHVPDAYAIVNPHQHDCPYPFKSFAGVGVTFKLLSLLYEYKQLTLPAKVYELLLLGTVADVVPLLGENRFWVRYGLSYINSMESASLKVLKSNGKLDKPKISATDIGFSIAPQINALGRLEDARQAVKFLIGTDEKEMAEVGKILLELNLARRDIERSIFLEVETAIAQKKIDVTKELCILAASGGWAAGVIGLVASRLVGTYGRPTILLHITKDGIAKGSCRSIPEFNIFEALQSCKDLLIQFGGHAMAAGLSLRVEDVEAFKARMESLIAAQLTPFDLKQKIVIDAEISLADVTKKFMTDITHMEPFGNANPQPVFCVNNVVAIQKPTLLKDAHVKCQVFADGVIKPLVFFNRPELFERLLAHGTEPFAVATHIGENYWSGRTSIELIGIDIAGLKGT